MTQDAFDSKTLLFAVFTWEEMGNVQAWVTRPFELWYRITHAFSAFVSVPLRPMTVSLKVSLPPVWKIPSPDERPTAESTNCLHRQTTLSRGLVPSKTHVLPTLALHRFPWCTAQTLSTAQRIRCVSSRPTCHTTSRQQHRSSCHRSAFRKASPISVRHRRELQTSLRKRFQFHVSWMCLASSPTEHCRSTRNNDRNSKRPTYVRKYECSSFFSAISSMTRCFLPQ